MSCLRGKVCAAGAVRSATSQGRREKQGSGGENANVGKESLGRERDALSRQHVYVALT